MKRVLIDASSAILLHKAQIFQDVATHYLLLMVPTVFSEITVAHHSGAEHFEEARVTGKIELVAVDPGTSGHKIASSLHAGELETIMAFKEDAARFIIMDDGRGARACRAMDIPYINALLCPSILYMSGKIDDLARQTAFRELKNIGRYGDEVIAYAKEANRDHLSSFFP